MQLRTQNNYWQTKYPAREPDAAAISEAKKREDQLIKPLGSLGALEDIAVRLAGLYGTQAPRVGKKRIIVMAADNGVTTEGVSSAPQAFTAIQTANIVKRLTGMCVLAGCADAEISVVDIGIQGELAIEGLVHRKIRNGTGNIRIEPAMSLEEAQKAIEIGIEQVRMAKEDGVTLLGIGEMGIGNTTTTAAILHALLPEIPVEQLVGKGAGLTEEGYQHKVQVIREAVQKHHPGNAMEALQKVGGLDIAGMVGCYLGAAHYGIPVVIDGVISMAAAYTAVQLNPAILPWLFASHRSAEPAYRVMEEQMHLHPVLDLSMRLGEGSGCPLMFMIMDAACRTLNEMATFDEIQTSGDFLVDIRE